MKVVNVWGKKKEEKKTQINLTFEGIIRPALAEKQLAKIFPAIPIHCASLWPESTKQNEMILNVKSNRENGMENGGIERGIV